MLSEQVDVVRMTDEAFMEEEGGSIPRLVHTNDKHPGLELIDRDRFDVFHLWRLVVMRAYRLVEQTDSANSLVGTRVQCTVLSG